MNQLSSLFSSVKLGDIELSNRIVMAPMTRDRTPGHVPNDANALYYEQRASAGLIITEGTAPDAMGQGYVDIPGLYTSEQATGWRRVTDRVHAKGGKIFVQLMYVGRVSHPDFLDGRQPVAPSAIKAAGNVYTSSGMKDFVVPRALGHDEIPGIVAAYKRAAVLAIDAGFDGVELHATSGYLPAQFLTETTNQRTDQYGGSLENRARFTLEVVDTLSSVRGSGRVGVRIGPGFTFNDIHDPDVASTYSYLSRQLDRKALAYLHVIDTKPKGVDVQALVRESYRGNLILNGGFDGVSANTLIASGGAQAVSFGSLFLSNPDLPARFAAGGPFNEPNKAGFYGGTQAGYTDYPTLEQVRAGASA